MPIASRISLPHMGFLAASVVVLTTVLPADPSLAHGSGGGHAAMEHAAPQAMPHSMPHSGGAVGTPAHGEPSRQSGSPAGGHAANTHAHHRDHHRGSKKTTEPTDTTTDVTTSPDTSTSTGTTTDFAAPSSASSTQQSTPSNDNTAPEPVETTGGTLAADTHPGGGGDTLAACMSFWKPDSHMTKGEWRSTCVRTLNGLDSGGGVTDNLAKTSTPHRAAAVQHRTR